MTFNKESSDKVMANALYQDRLDLKGLTNKYVEIFQTRHVMSSCQIRPCAHKIGKVMQASIKSKLINANKVMKTLISSSKTYKNLENP